MEKPDPSRKASPIFIVGVWRSGTSLLASLVNQHPEIALMYECAALDFPRALEKLRMKGGWLERQEFFNQALSRHRLIFGGSLRGLEQVATPEDLYRVFAAGKSATHWGEKAPTYARRLRLLAEKYPQGSIIVIWRDPVEIVRSIRQAGQETRYFRRRGILARTLGHLERMLADTAFLAQRGHRLLHADYDALVNDTEGTMRRICAFIGVEYHARMATLEGADFSTLIPSAIHKHLCNGVIARQTNSAGLPPKLSAKLSRFQNRALRLRGLTDKCGDEPSAGEIFRVRLSSGFWFTWDSAKRVLFEFLPLAWLRSYRMLKAMFAAPNAPSRRLTRGELAGNIATITAAYGILALNLYFKFAKPNLQFLPLTLLSCGALTLVIHRNWGLFVGGVAAFSVPVAQWFADTDYANPATLVWNSLMRFAVLAIFVFLLDAARANSSARNQTS